MHARKGPSFRGTGTSPLISREGRAGPYTYRGRVDEPRDIVAALHAELAARKGRIPDAPPEGDAA